MKDAILNVLQTIFRMVPHPVRPRMLRVGHPGHRSPVLVTTNFAVTVRRVKKALRGVDCYLLIAPAGGINVWCGSVGGQFSVESIISIVKTSGIERCVDHRRLILPQLCAPAISSAELHRRIGWSALFGPVRAEDIPEFLRRNRKVTPEMTLVRYGVKERLEMAVAMWGSITLRYTALVLLLAPFWGVGWTAGWFVASVAAVSLLLHQLSERVPARSDPQKGVMIAATVFPLFALAEWGLGSGLDWRIFGLALITLIAGYLCGHAHAGYTPFKQCSYSKRFYGQEPIEIHILADDCTGCKLCEQVCPVGCFDLARDSRRKRYVMARPDDCVECGACLVQCPTNAVVNVASPTGEVATGVLGGLVVPHGHGARRTCTAERGVG